MLKSVLVRSGCVVLMWPLWSCSSESPDVARSLHAIEGVSAQQVLGFEAASLWQGPAVEGTSDTHTEGAVSLAVHPTEYSLYTSKPFANSGIPRRLLLDIQQPSGQINPYWLGHVELYVDCPVQGVFNSYLGQVSLTGKPVGSFTTLAYDVPRNVQERLTNGCSAMTVKIGLNVLGDSGTYLLDNMRILTDLVLNYAFDDPTRPVLDSSGYERHGRLMGAASLAAEGRQGSALQLDGGSGYVELPDGITQGLKEMTVSAWVNIAQAGAWSRIFDFGGSAGFLYLTPSTHDGLMRYSAYAGQGNEGTITAPSLARGVWKHVAITTRGRDYRLFVDGVEAANQPTLPVTPAEIGVNVGNWIGRSRFPDPLLAGRIDDFRIYDRVLSATEVAKLARPQRDYMHYRFDETSGTVATDSSNLARHGVLTDGALFGNGSHAGGLSLSGRGGHVALPPGIVSECRDFTASTWVKLRSNAPWSRVFDFGNASHDSFMYLSPAGFGPSGQEIRFGLVAPNGIADVGYPFVVPLDEWQHLAVVLQQGTAKLYFNGRVVKTQSGITSVPADMGTTLQNYFGKSNFPDPTFDGFMDEVRIACRAYDGTEIQQLAHLPAPRTLPKNRPLTGVLEHVHDPVVAKEAGRYYVFSTGAGLPIRTSVDFTHWEAAGNVFAANPAWVTERFGALDALWAPDVAYFNGVHHLYYSASTFGSNRSCIGMATKTVLDPAEPWTDRGPIVCSNFDGAQDDWNAIDPNVVIDAAGTPWMAFGSYWSGIKMVRLDADGRRADSTIYSLARRPSTAIEAPYIVYRAPYYYMFASFDSCCQGANSTYKTMVGRSTSVTGPYLDRTGLDMMQGGGTPVVVGNARFRGPGHNAIVREGERTWNVYHAYDVLRGGVPTLRISELFWQEGWPVSAEP